MPKRLAGEKQYVYPLSMLDTVCPAAEIHCNSALSKGAFQELVSSLGFQVQPQDEAGYLDLLRAAIADVETVQAMPRYHHPLLQKTDGTGERVSWQPSPAENPLNGWSYRVGAPLSSCSPQPVLPHRLVTEPS
jgi:hypothetical protein